MPRTTPPATRETLSAALAPLPGSAMPWMRDLVQSLSAVLDRMQQDIDTIIGRRGDPQHFNDVNLNGNDLMNIGDLQVATLKATDIQSTTEEVVTLKATDVQTSTMEATSTVTTATVQTTTLTATGTAQAALLKATGNVEAVTVKATGHYEVNNIQVVGAQQAHVANLATPGGTADDDIARAGVNAVLAVLAAHGLMA